MAEGHKALITPYNTSEFQEMIDEIRSHHNRMNDQARAVAADLRKLLPKAKGGALSPIRADLHLHAVRVTRQLAHAAALNTAAARTYTMAYTIYVNSFTNAGTGAHGRGFDVDK